VLGRERLGSRRHQNLISVCFCRSIGILIFGRLSVAQSTDPIVIPGIIIALSHTELPKYATNLALKRPRIWIADGVACRISQRPLIGNTEPGANPRHGTSHRSEYGPFGDCFGVTCCQRRSMWTSRSSNAISGPPF